MNPSVTLDEIRSFIHTHTLTNWSSEDSLSYILVDDPTAFLKLVCASDYYVQGVTWFDHALTEHGSALAPTGPIDPRDSRYAYYITYLDDTFPPDITLDEYLLYVTIIRQSYPTNVLHPGFHLSSREEKT